jgi:hypothetical protein
MTRMKIGIGRILFTLISLLIIVVAYGPALHINLGFGGSNSIVAASQVHVYGGPIKAQWDINSLDVVQNGASSQTLSLWYPTGQVCAVYRLYGASNNELQSGTVCNPSVMDWGGAGSSWDSSWTFSGLSSGQYKVGVTYYENSEARTNELVKGVMVP